MIEKYTCLEFHKKLLKDGWIEMGRAGTVVSYVFPSTGKTRSLDLKYDTTVYTTASANSLGYNKYFAVAPTTKDDGDATSEANMTKMETDDGTSFVVNGGAGATWQTFKFRITEAEGNISLLAIHVDGFLDSNGGDYQRIRCWNDKNSEWDIIANVSDSSTETDYDTSINADIADYIDSNGDIYWQLLVFGGFPVLGVSVDYVGLTVTYSGAAPAPEVNDTVTIAEDVNLAVMGLPVGVALDEDPFIEVVWDR